MSKNNGKSFLFLFMGAMSAFGPFVTDMYLPSLPSMTGYFHTTTSMVQLGLTFSMLGLASGQLIFGPLSDNIGRRRPLIWAMILFLLSTIGCILSPNIELFVALRFLQGIAGSSGIVISRSIAADSFQSKELAKALAIVAAINGIAPVVAPVIGGTMCNAVGWQGIFMVLLSLGVALCAMCLFFRESLPTERMTNTKASELFPLFIAVAKKPRFLPCALEMAFAQGVLFAYIASSPFIIQNSYGFSAFAFSIFFAVNSIAIAVGAASSALFKRMETPIQISVIGMLLGSGALMVILAAQASIVWFEIAMFITLFLVGMSFTSATAIALNACKDNSGTGSAIIGASGFFMGGLVSPIVGLGNIFYTTGIVFVSCALLALAFGLLICRQPNTSALPANKASLAIN